MIDGAAFRERLEGYGVTKARTMLAEGRFGEDKRALVEDWLQRKEAEPVVSRRWRGLDPVARYQPSAGDLAYRNAFKADPDLDPFEEAMLLQGVSDAYLSVLASDHTTPQTAGFKAMIDAEVTRRGSAIAKRANLIAWISLGVAIASFAIALH